MRSIPAIHRPAILVRKPYSLRRKIIALRMTANHPIAWLSSSADSGH